MDNVTSKVKADATGEMMLFDLFLRSFYSLLQTVKIHDDSNRMTVDGVNHFVEALGKSCVDEDSLTIKNSNGRIYVNDEKIKYTKDNKYILDNTLEYLGRRGLDGLRIDIAMRESSIERILSFIRLLDRAEREPVPISWLLAELEDNAYPWVECLSISQQGDGEDGQADSPGKKARKHYTYALASFKEVAQKVTCQKRAGVRKTVRVIQEIVEDILEDEDIFSAMSTLRIFDDYTFTHSVNVALLSMCIGKRIGLSKKALERLGTAAIFHDLGKIEVPRGLLNKPGKLTEAEFEKIQKHSLNSARLIVKLRAARDRKAQILLPPFEHHLKYDLSGYPRTNWKNPITLFGRIITIADVYDAITSARVYRATTLSPDRALGRMLQGAGVDFDPIILKVFINMLGVYPVGTLLKFDTNELGLVKQTSEEDFGARPIVVLLIPDGRGGYQKGSTVDLTEFNFETNDYLRNITESLHPSDYGIQPAEFLL
jgi:HD-GYP domain-containing protein (c-di-GMP phosphodiesterase class II)